MARGTEIARGYIAVTVDEDGARSALRGFVSFAGSAFKAAAASAAVLVGAAVKIGIEFNAMKEQASIAFATLLGSGEKAQAMLADLQKFAASTPFELPGLIDNARQLLGVGVAADKVIPTMTALGNAAGALGLSQDAFNRILLATTQAMGKGKLQGEELLQMVEAGIPVWQLLAKATGKPVPELQKLSEQGKLLSAEVLPKLFDQMNKDYGGAMAAQSKTLVGQWSSLKDNGRILVATAMKPLFDETKNLVGALGELAASKGANQWAEGVATRLDVAIDAVKLFGRNVRTELGDEFGRALDKTRSRFEELWPVIKDGASDALEAAGKIGAQVAPQLVQLATAASGLLKPALEAVAGVLRAVSENADEIASGLSTAAQTVGAIAGPAFRILGQVLQIVGGALELLVNLVGDLSGPLGVVAGIVLTSVVAWRALSVVLGVVSGLWSKVAPSAVAASLAGMTKSVDNVALKAGIMTESLTGSAKAGERVATAGSKVGSVLTKVGAALPVVGLAAVGLGIAFEASAQNAAQSAKDIETFASALLKGGAAADEVQKKLNVMRGLIASGKLPESVAAQFQGDIDKITAAMQRQVSEMTNVQRAQADVTKAQQDYDLAVRTFGPTSQQAVTAQQVLVTATNTLAREQDNAARATKSHEIALFDLANQALVSANADLQLRQSRLAIKQAEEAAAAAVRDHGAGSLEAEAAQLSLEQAYIRAAEAARQKALADSAGMGPQQQAIAGTAAYNQELLRMAIAAGENAPPALRKLLGNISDAELASFEAAAATGQFKTQVLTLPDGRTVKIAVDDQGSPVLIKNRDLLAVLHDKTITLTVQERRILQTEVRALGRAIGGPVRAGVPYMVGERGPEVVIPGANSYVQTADRTRRMMQDRGRSGVNVENLHLHALTDRWSLEQVATELHWAGIR